MDVSCRGIAPNWGAIKQPAKNKAINDLKKCFLIMYMLNSIDLDQFVYTTSNSFTYVFIIGEALI